jgi:hypothetical protein
MASTIKVDKLDPQSGTALEIGSSGDTATIPSGATLTIASGATLTNNGTATGFAGIAWQSITTAATLTTVAGKGYPINTTSNACTVTLPGSASVGDQVQIVDYAGTFATNNITLTSSLKIEGGAADKILTTNREGVTITYVDVTQGWVATSGVNSGDQAIDPITYLADFLVIAGGGSGSAYSNSGGGGAGGYRTATAQTLNGGTVYTVTVGDGGAAVSSTTIGNAGSASSISGSGLTTITSAGGGRGGTDATVGGDGGSGGGGGNSQAGGSGNTPSTSPSQGNNGGLGVHSAPAYGGGGGGGAGAVGQAGTSSKGGDGGAGTASSITSASVTRAGGGGGGTDTTIGSGGSGGGGNGGSQSGPGNGGDGTVNTGSGGGGCENGATSGAGGKGVVILSVPDADYSTTTTGSPTVVTDAGGTGKTVMTFTGTGSYTA